MHKYGHYGAALLAYTPPGAVLLALGRPELAGAAAVAMLAGAMLPDWDQRVPLLSHRGFSHTVWFAILLGAAAASVVLPMAGEGPALVAGIVGLLSVAAHIAADALTPMGVRPFWPVDSTSYSAKIVRADNRVANGALFASGLLCTGLMVGLFGGVL
jgi:inner membrane protein